MKFVVVVIFGLFVGLSAFAKSARCVSEDSVQQPVAVLMNIEKLSKAGEFQANLQLINQQPIEAPSCRPSSDLMPEVHCMFHMPAPSPSYFLKFSAFNPEAAINHGQLFVYSYGKNNRLVTNVVCSNVVR